MIYRHKGQELNTCLFSRMSQIFATREELAPEPKHLRFPRGASKRRQRKPTGRRHSSSETEALVPKNTVQTVQSPCPKIDHLRNGRYPWEQKLPTGSQEKKSHVSEAAGGEDQNHRKEKGARILACSLSSDRCRTQMEEANRERKKREVWGWG